MMVMTAKVDLKKILLIIAAAAALILGAILLMGGDNTAQTAATGSNLSGNDARVQFLKDFGWEVTTSPTQSGQVRIPETASPVFERYNTLQKSQGYDLSAYAGKQVTRYVYQINNYPGATEPVYATLLVHKNKIIGGDITDTAAHGKIRGFAMPESAPATTAGTVPAESTDTRPATH